MFSYRMVCTIIVSFLDQVVKSFFPLFLELVVEYNHKVGGRDVVP